MEFGLAEVNFVLSENLFSKYYFQILGNFFIIICLLWED